MAVKHINGAYQQGPEFRVHKGKDSQEKILEFNGKWELVEASAPKYGSIVKGYEDYIVVEVDARRTEGGRGKLVVKLRKKGNDSGEDDPESTLISDKLAVRWVRSQRALADSTFFTSGSASDVKMSQIECWKREKDHALRAAFKFRAPVLYGTTVVTWQEFEITDAKTLKLCKKLLAGQTGYWWWYPVVRRRRVYSEPLTQELTLPTIYTAAALLNRLGGQKTKTTPSGEKVYRRHIPTKGLELDAGGAMAEFSYKYLLTGYDMDEGDDDEWAVTEEWLGAKEFDADYYGS